MVLAHVRDFTHKSLALPARIRMVSCSSRDWQDHSGALYHVLDVMGRGILIQGLGRLHCRDRPRGRCLGDRWRSLVLRGRLPSQLVRLCGPEHRSSVEDQALGWGTFTPGRLLPSVGGGAVTGLVASPVFMDDVVWAGDVPARRGLLPGLGVAVVLLSLDRSRLRSS